MWGNTFHCAKVQLSTGTDRVRALRNAESNTRTAFSPISARGSILQAHALHNQMYVVLCSVRPAALAISTSSRKSFPSSQRYDAEQAALAHLEHMAEGPLAGER